MTFFIVWVVIAGAVFAWGYAWLTTWYERARGAEPLWRYLARKARRE